MRDYFFLLMFEKINITQYIHEYIYFGFILTSIGSYTRKQPLENVSSCVDIDEEFVGVVIGINLDSLDN